jgi:steroid delta-isomerase-like uncharacterized protein
MPGILKVATGESKRRERLKMGIEMTKMLEDYFTAWNSGDAGKVLSFFTDDCIYEDVSLNRVVQGKTDLRFLLESVFADIAGFRMEIKSVFSSGTWGASEWTMSGRFVHSNDSGLTATGKSFLVRGATVFELSNRKISRNTDYLDLTAFLRQVGTTFNPVVKQ